MKLSPIVICLFGIVSFSQSAYVQTPNALDAIDIYKSHISEKPKDISLIDDLIQPFEESGKTWAELVARARKIIREDTCKPELRFIGTERNLPASAAAPVLEYLENVWRIRNMEMLFFDKTNAAICIVLTDFPAWLFINEQDVPPPASSNMINSGSARYLNTACCVYTDERQYCNMASGIKYPDDGVPPLALVELLKKFIAQNEDMPNAVRKNLLFLQERCATGDVFPWRWDSKSRIRYSERTDEGIVDYYLSFDREKAGDSLYGISVVLTQTLFFWSDYNKLISVPTG
jgi:hypothetical protein